MQSLRLRMVAVEAVEIRKHGGVGRVERMLSPGRLFHASYHTFRKRDGVGELSLTGQFGDLFHQIW